MNAHQRRTVFRRLRRRYETQTFYPGEPGDGGVILGDPPGSGSWIGFDHAIGPGDYSAVTLVRKINGRMVVVMSKSMPAADRAARGGR